MEYPAQQFFISDATKDSFYARRLKTWIVCDLHKKVEQVQFMQVDVDIIDLPQEDETEWRTRKIGDFIHFTLYFDDDTHYNKTFAFPSEEKHD